jgi:hypothetical protein
MKVRYMITGNSSRNQVARRHQVTRLTRRNRSTRRKLPEGTKEKDETGWSNKLPEEAEEEMAKESSVEIEDQEGFYDVNDPEEGSNYDSDGVISNRESYESGRDAVLRSPKRLKLSE